jgi:hypothetical protein
VGDIKQVPYRGPTNIRRLRTKFSCWATWLPGFMHAYLKRLVFVMEERLVCCGVGRFLQI